MWLEHLLLLSMLQHPSGGWPWGRYAVVHPPGNSDYADRAPATQSCSPTIELPVDDTRGAARLRRPAEGKRGGPPRPVHPRVIAA